MKTIRSRPQRSTQDPVVIAGKKLSEAFRHLNATFQQNYSGKGKMYMRMECKEGILETTLGIRDEYGETKLQVISEPMP